jgi:uncharacterized protein YmfQ (DUF2313 family)
MTDPTDRHVRRSGEDYAEPFAALLPTGPAWPREPDTALMALILALSEIWGNPVDHRAADLLERESDPRETIELLPDWERNWGLPDPCFTTPQTIGDRQKALVRRMTLLGGQSRAWFHEVADEIGYPLVIREFSPFMAGVSNVGDTRNKTEDGHFRWYVGGWDMRFYWTTTVSQARLTWFRCTKGQCGVDPHLRIGVPEDTACIFNRWKPAHTVIVYDFTNLEMSDPMQGTP